MSRIGDLYQENKLIQDTILAKKRLEAISLRKIQKPSDNPFDAARVIVNHDILKNIEQYKRNIDFVKPPLEFTSHVLDTIFDDIISRARTDAIRADGILTDTEAHAIATEIELLKKKLLDYANSTFYGSYIFSGTKVYQEPFTFAYSEFKSYNAFGNIYNTEVLSHNSVSDLDSVALSNGDVLSFSIGEKTIYIKALKDMSLEEVVEEINRIAVDKDVPLVATTVKVDGGYKLFIRSGDPNNPPSQINFGTVLGNPTVEDFPQIVLQEGKTLTVEVKNLEEDISYFVTLNADKNMGLSDVEKELNTLFEEKELNVRAVIRKTTDGRNYLSIITGDSNLRIAGVTDTGGKIVPSDVDDSQLIINNSSGKIVYLGNYVEKEVLIDDKRTVKSNVVIADEISKLWDTLSVLESAVLSKAQPFVITGDTAELDDVVLTSGSTFSFEFDGNTIEIKADTDLTLEELVEKINKRLNEMGLEAQATVQPDIGSEFYLKISSLNSAKTISNVYVEDATGVDITSSFMGGISYTTSSTDFISYAIKSIDRIMQFFNYVREKEASDLSFVEYVQDRLMEKEVSISESTDELENAKLEETLAQMSQYDAVYQMNLVLLSKITKVSLLDFIK